jgi:hypothetical protein
VVSAADTYARVNHNLNQLWKANRARRVARELEEEAEIAAEHQAEEEAAAAEAAAQAKAEQEAAAKRAAEKVAPTPPTKNTSLTDAYTEANHVKDDASTPAPKPAKVQTASERVEEDAPVEPKFPTDWIKNDVKFNADVDTMEQREKSIQERVKKQQAWKATREAWIQTKVFHLRSWGSTVA